MFNSGKITLSFTIHFVVYLFKTRLEMLQHQKHILKALQNEPVLFLKEVQKSFQWLSDQEIEYLKSWLKTQYPELYRKRIKYLFIMNPT